MRVSILQGDANGTVVYMETQTAVTNANGLITLQIGSGNVQQGSFVDIDWTTGSYFLKTETDPAGGTYYSVTGTQQLLSVPYALYAPTTPPVSVRCLQATTTAVSAVSATAPASGALPRLPMVPFGTAICAPVMLLWIASAAASFTALPSAASAIKQITNHNSQSWAWPVRSRPFSVVPFAKQPGSMAAVLAG